MSNVINSQISASVSTPFVFKEESNVSLTNETLCLVGTASKGPAFVPQQFTFFDENINTLNTWENVFGKYDDQEFDVGPITSKVWMESGGNQLSYIRVLGVPNTDNAGFISGDLVLSGSIDDHIKGESKFSVSGGDYGKVHFLTSVVSNINTDGYISPYKDYLKQINIENSDDTTEIGVVTDVIMCMHGVSLYLQNDEIDNINITRKKKELATKTNTEPAFIGSNFTNIKSPMLYVQGINDSSKNTLKLYYDNFLKSNFKVDYINEDIEWTLEKGHYNYSKFRNTSNFKKSFENNSIKYMMLTNNDNWGESQINYENFNSGFKKAKTPWVVSQPIVKSSENIENISKKDIHKSCIKLFRFHAYDDGVSGNNFRFRIIPRRKGNINANSEFEMWSLFDIMLYKYENERFVLLEHFKSLNLNPHSKNYICNIIGTEHEFYNFDTQKIESAGDYKKTNNYVYVEVNLDIEDMIINKDLTPCGFMPYPRINLDNSLLNIPDEFTSSVIQNPLRLVGNHILSDRDDSLMRFEERYWGVLFDHVYVKKFNNIKISGQTKNIMFDVKKEKSLDKNDFALEYTKYFKNDYLNLQNNVWIEDLSDNDVDFYNGFFHLEKILYAHNEDSYEKMWNCAFYQRDGRPISEINEVDELIYKYVEIDNLLLSNTLDDSVYSKYLHFDFMTYGGFDGLNILDNYKKSHHDVAIMREYSGEIINKTTGQIYDAYSTCFDIINNDENYLYDIFSMPSISHIDLLKKISQASKEKQFLFIADIPEILYNDNSINSNYENVNSYRLDPYHFKNIDKINDQYLDERDDIQYLTIQGTEKTIENFQNNNFQSEYSFFAMNSVESSIRNKKNILLPPSVLTINTIASKSVEEPLDFDNIVSPDFVSYDNILNKNFIYNNNKFDSLLKTTKNAEVNINSIGIISSNKTARLMSSNTAIVNNKNENRLFHNIRIKNKIIRELKDLLIRQPIFQGSTILFGLNSKSNSLFNLKSSLLISLEEYLGNYINEGIIKNYSIYIDVADLDRRFNENYLNNIINGEISIQLFGKENNNLVRLDINKLINNINDFTSEQDVNIINNTI